MPNNLTIRVGGEGGEGVISTGEMLTAALARTRRDVCTFRTYPAEIKGGPAMFQVRCGNHPVLDPGSALDVLVAFNEEAIQLHGRDLKNGGLLIYDMDSVDLNSRFPNATTYGVPMTGISQNEVGTKRVKNVVAFAVVSKLLDLPEDATESLVKDRFGSKGQAILEKNIKAIQAGYEYVKHSPISADLIVPPSVRKEAKVVMSGNEAMAAGAIAAGCRYYAGYPITPASDILSFMEENMPKFGGIAIQTEDEMAALASCLGASFAGTKAMTATSGPGFSLMIELIGLASMIELPVVIVDAQRAGPSTGMPTKTEQSDLFLAVFGGHGDAPRVVLAPATVKDCFYGIVKAFNIAEEYQIPVVMLSDADLSHRTQTFTRPKLTDLEVVNRLRPTPPARGQTAEPYQRFKITPNGVSPMAVPGDEGLNYVVTGLEHDEFGDPNYLPSNHFRMTAKRHKKLEFIAKKKGFTRRFGDEHAKVGIISWGSTEGAIEGALSQASKYGYEVSALQLKMLHPLPDEEIKSFMAPLKTVIVPELNFSGMLAHLLRAQYLTPIVQLNKCGGVPFTTDDILKKIEEVYQRG